MALEQPAVTGGEAKAAVRAASGHSTASGLFRYGMTLPTIVALALVVGFPLLFALFVSTHAYDLTEGGIGEFTGWANYAKTLKDDLFLNAARNTAVLAVSVVLIELCVALGLSLLLNRPGLRFRNVYLAILLIPLLIISAMSIDFGASPFTLAGFGNTIYLDVGTVAPFALTGPADGSTMTLLTNGLDALPSAGGLRLCFQGAVIDPELGSIDMTNAVIVTLL